MGTPKKSAKKMQGQLRPRTTRSSKARRIHQLASDPMENTALLTEQLRSLGLYAAPTIGDGNCLFRALSDQLYGSPSRHPQLRRDVCDWIAGHKARYEPFVEDDRGLDVHLRCMRENGRRPSLLRAACTLGGYYASACVCTNAYACLTPAHPASRRSDSLGYSGSGKDDAVWGSAWA
ncbi:hypothetical protein K438DRAFT_1991469 [Mycena galopus ATCC 62051]|nr:hypothetical protein K438DRAFT_1991469 [Mycena galopus ATCC 62051]